MKIRTKLSLRYSLVTAAVFTVFVLMVHISTDRNREKEFFNDLKKEAVTKTNLFLSGRVEPSTMHSIYLNNREFIHEVEVAIYDTEFSLVYHDAREIDIVKETPEMLSGILLSESTEFYQEGYQVVGMTYLYGGEKYIITAAAYDGYGYAKQKALTNLLFIIWLIGIIVIAVAGYLLARSALSPVSRIVDEVEGITESNLDSRLPIINPKDELGELARTFNGMLERLDKSFDSQKMFVSNVSHELRTPLAALIAELELALLKPHREEEDYRQVISNALDDAKKLERLSGGLLDMARANYEPGRIKMQDVRLDELLLDARETVIKANRGYSVELIFEQESEDDHVITVKGNEYLLRTALVNLIENNCKFSDNKSSLVQISYFGADSILRFSDTGIGIGEDDKNNLFNPFYRGQNKDYTSGNGIGMALVHKIITMHKGSVEVHSHLGEGTVFIVRLPHISPGKEL